VTFGADPFARGAEQRGSVVVLFAFLLPVLLLTLALAIDVGNWFVHRRHLQMQADAAALAGGARFGDCFSPDAGVSGAADTTIESAATRYAGNASSTYNFQIGGGAARVTTLFNSRTFAAGGPPADDTETGGPCETPHLMLDVKQTETDVPYILGSLVDAIVPGSPTIVPAINARARVQLKKATILSGMLPLAVPDLNPRHVTATFVNETAGGTLIAGPLDLTKGASAGGINYWSGSQPVTIPAGVKVGVRIGLGGQAGPCAAANGTGGSGYVCYDFNSSSTGLVAINAYGSGGTVNVPEPHAWATTSCTGSPFFSDASVTAPATTCSVSVQAVLKAGAVDVDPAKKKVFKAILNGAGLNNVAADLTYSAASGYWSTGYVFSVPVQGGPVDVSLQWQSTNAGAKQQTYTNIQRVYSGSDDASGPVKALSLSSSTSTLGSPYALAGGQTHTIGVSVGVAGGLSLTDSATTTMLRLTGGSRTSAVACDGPGANEFRAAIINGCQTPYQLNDPDVCPDPAAPAGPADCVPTKTGTTAGPTLQGLDARYAACPADNWPNYDAGTDPRVVKLLITDFSALGGSGTTDVPVTNFGAFYITGWTGSTCSNNAPAPGDVKKGAIWGHFIKYVAPDPFSGGTEDCDPLALAPCIPVLVK
jgi:putative Flp pilus-assembly TadE/G-like protein